MWEFLGWIIDRGPLLRLTAPHELIGELLGFFLAFLHAPQFIFVCSEKHQLFLFLRHLLLKRSNHQLRLIYLSQHSAMTWLTLITVGWSLNVQPTGLGINTLNTKIIATFF